MNSLDQILELKAHIALVAALNLIGFLLKQSPVRNWLIPWILILLGAATWPIIAEYQSGSYTTRMATYNVIVGVLLAGSAVGMHQAVQAFPILFKSKEKPKEDK